MRTFGVFPLTGDPDGSRFTARFCRRADGTRVAAGLTGPACWTAANRCGHAAPAPVGNDDRVPGHAEQDHRRRPQLPRPRRRTRRGRSHQPADVADGPEFAARARGRRSNCRTRSTGSISRRNWASSSGALAKNVSAADADELHLRLHHLPGHQRPRHPGRRETVRARQGVRHVHAGGAVRLSAASSRTTCRSRCTKTANCARTATRAR